jgi:DNA topoisomerase-2
VKVFLDDERIKIKDFSGYCELYLQSMGKMTETGEAPKSVHIKPNDRWEIIVAVSDGQFQQVSLSVSLSLSLSLSPSAALPQLLLYAQVSRKSLKRH